jgi:hypothetical protein
MNKFVAEPVGSENQQRFLPLEIRLFQNYPNPFSARGGSAYGGNPETAIHFQLPEFSSVVIKIYNTLGQEIRTLIDKEFESGYHTVLWDGRDNFGNPVLCGEYFYQLRAGNFSQLKKMMLLR